MRTERGGRWGGKVWEVILSVEASESDVSVSV